MEVLEKYEKIANEMLVKHNLTDWKFVIDTNVKSRLGQCRYNEKEVAISEYILKLRHEQIVDTIIHEIAHALTEGHNHDKVWKEKCIELGCIPLSTYMGGFNIYKPNNNYKFEGSCPTCSKTYIKSKPTGLCSSCYHESYMTKKDINSQLIFEKYE